MLIGNASAQSAAQDCQRLSGDQAITACGLAIQQNPRDAKAVYNRGLHWSAKGDNDRAISDYSEAIRLDPKDAIAFSNRGNEWSAKGNNDRAMSDYSEAIRLNPQLAMAFFNRGTQWFNNGDKNRAISDYSEAIRLAPKDASAVFNRGRAWEETGNKDKAIIDYSLAISINPKLAVAFGARGYAWYAKGDNAKAMADYNEAIRLNPQDAKSFNNRGFVWLKNSDPDKAIADFNEAIRLNPQFAIAFGARGYAWSGKGDNDRAISDYSEAIRLAPQDPSAVFNRGRAWEAKGHFAHAVVDFENFVRLNPNDPDGPKAVHRIMATIASQQKVIAQQPTPATAPQGRRVALVIGNTNYQAQSRLMNPGNDANLIASSLRAAGFQQVIVKNDLTQNQLLRAIRDFAEVADKADWSVVYYAGHGIGYNGANYMIPVDARLKADRDIDIEAVDVGKIYNAISGSKSLRLVILDMCRTNPFAKTMTRTLASRSVGRGLVAPIESEAGEFTVFAAKDGQESQDGEGKNSPFAEALAKRLLIPNTDITRIFAYVRDDVMRVTNKQQQPFTYGSLPPADYFFVQK